ncbi:glycerol kinase GlpK [bacterium]|nr:glycerol kinase GlpK [candidate division CSSED10-310 bacterium]
MPRCSYPIPSPLVTTPVPLVNLPLPGPASLHRHRPLCYAVAHSWTLDQADQAFSAGDGKGIGGRIPVVKADYIVAIDQGTTGSRVFVFDREAHIVAGAYSEFTQYYPKPGWVEHDAEEIWQVTWRVLQEALNSANVQWAQVRGIGITNQRETTVVWDRLTGKPIHRAIVWQCRRTAKICDQLREKGLAEIFSAATGLVLDAYFSGTKVKWLLDEVPGARDRAERGGLCFGTIDSWLVWNLSGGGLHVTDMTNASRTLMFNIHTREWDDRLLAELTVPRSMLPEVKSSSAGFGSTTPELTGVPVPIGGIAGDQQAALFGQLCVAPGMVKNTYGTGCFMVMNTGERAIASKNGLLTTLACAADGSPCFALEGSVFIAGAAVQWLRDELRFIDESAKSEKLAAQVEDSDGVYVVPAFVGLGAPYWDMYAKGAILGLTRGTNRAHIARATLESIAYQSHDLLRAMGRDAGVSIEALRVDGGACRNNLLMQFQADIMDCPVDRPAMIETTVLGAAFLAGLAVGFWNGAEELARFHRSERRFEPGMAEAERERRLAGWRDAVSRVLVRRGDDDQTM